MTSTTNATPSRSTPSAGTKRPLNKEGESATKRSSPSKNDGGKASKGLRHFSMKVCKKVEEKGHTSYNEVADDLVKEFMEARKEEESGNANEDESVTPSPNKKGKNTPGYDEKNIRRRVYDALNVLMAMDIISKEKKEIRWKGLPSNAHHDLEKLHNEKTKRLREVQQKQECLKDLLVQQVCFRNLVKRNREREEEGERERQYLGKKHPPNLGNQGEKIPLPFIVVNTSDQTVIQCEMGPDRVEVFFNFSKPFEINDDNEILKRLGLNKITIEELRKMLPRDLLNYCQEHRMLDSIVVQDSHGPPHHPNNGSYPHHPPPLPPGYYNQMHHGLPNGGRGTGGPRNVKNNGGGRLDALAGAGARADPHRGGPY
mmetsp:Transcript_43653/g.64031  ORF Transcript_43653/g.64031 Transcript_43653/m.64031 type:complete len:371 (-) Transcript_43653:460-1572(-)|eukprot:CAMPEP_0195513184 /NCGR_PEP_ID=MMETSP0794_2-20130614/4890_1 /TAXON_ID=515487 /ORGANISM="Stephanopyxis turris, Strain CCMP 815" /LENGTH=370 /DNA_ID=CAMNT_0040641123 /DNA_START=243 /DNA_END=1355 /DNA_ORIENTATION=+